MGIKVYLEHSQTLKALAKCDLFSSFNNYMSGFYQACKENNCFSVFMCSVATSSCPFRGDDRLHLHFVENSLREKAQLQLLWQQPA